jgi:hypothetical protein
MRHIVNDFTYLNIFEPRPLVKIDAKRLIIVVFLATEISILQITLQFPNAE